MLRNTTIFLFAACFIFIKCGKKTDDSTEIPLGILSQNKLAGILVDFAIAESAANLNIKGLPMQKVDSAYRFNPLLDHDVRKTQYDSSLQFYAAHPELYKVVYDTVLARLGKLKVSRLDIKSTE